MAVRDVVPVPTGSCGCKPEVSFADNEVGVSPRREEAEP